jgi:hypothetical protein
MTKRSTKSRRRAQDGPLYVRTDISPEEVFKAIGRLRKAARDEIDRLIRFLDDTENHMSRTDDDEPSLGWTNSGPFAPQCGGADDLEADSAELEDGEPAEDDGLREPSLGSIGDVHFDQRRWSLGDRRDLERDEGESGIADLEGLFEQIGTQGWGGGMV